MSETVPRFTIGDTEFLLDGAPFRVLAGSIHYFRIEADQWADRIEKARLMGLNTIETYVAWNEHVPVRGTFITDGQQDLVRFLRLVAEAGMYAIVRPGPYICAEWDNGGLPGWLFSEPGLQLRRNNAAYMSAVREYLDALLPILAPLQIEHGGPIILMQIENEYGAYGRDKVYLQALVDITRANGITVPLTTVDQPTDQMLQDGTLPELHTTGSFGSRAKERLEILRRHQPTGPLMCSEFWDGWFDHWGEHHHVTEATSAARELEVLLAAGASVTLYMFTGGTNFGFTNGANHKGIYKSHVTSYDYDAPLDEAGNPTGKYAAFKDVISRYATVPEANPAVAVTAPTLETPFVRSIPLASVHNRLGTWRQFDAPPAMDDFAQWRGLCIYRTTLGGRGGVLAIDSVRDRAIVFVDGTAVGVLERDRHDHALTVPAGQVLELLVEDRGRVNYGERLGEPKGIVGGAFLDSQELRGWDILPLDLDEISADLLDGGELVPASVAGPAFLHAYVRLDDAVDLFLDTSSWGKGVAWFNGFNLGRYWSRGPQQTLYIPRGQTRPGKNDLVILEMHAIADPSARFVGTPRLGHSEE